MTLCTVRLFYKKKNYKKIITIHDFLHEKYKSHFKYNIDLKN